MIAPAAGLAVWWLARRRWPGAAIGAGVIATLTVAAPLAGAAAGAVGLAAHRWRRAAAKTRRDRADDADVVLLADLVVLAAGAGLSLRAAFEEAGRHVAAGLAAEVDRLIESMDRVGVAAALAGAGGRLAGLGRVAAGAAVSGAPIATAVASFASTERHAAHAAAVERARRLPVRMLMPLALLILPGFVVLAVGPAVLEALARLGPVP